MPVGYSLDISQRNKGADASRLGVKLGAVCIQRDISVRDVAAALGVSRQTIYNWFVGTSNPHVDVQYKVEDYLANLP